MYYFYTNRKTKKYPLYKRRQERGKEKKKAEKKIGKVVIGSNTSEIANIQMN